MERFVWDDFTCSLPFERVQKKLLLEEPEDIALMRARHAQALEIARPKAVFRVSFVDGIEGDRVSIEGTVFESAVLARNLKGVHRVFAYVMTCGQEVDEWSRREEDVFVSLWLDMLKEMILGEARQQFVARLKERFGLEKVSSMNPGAGNVDVWPIAQQRPLFDLIGDVEKDTGARLTDSFLILPTKSVSGVMFPTETSFVTCALCTREHCPNRRTPPQDMV